MGRIIIDVVAAYSRIGIVNAINSTAVVVRWITAESVAAYDRTGIAANNPTAFIGRIITDCVAAYGWVGRIIANNSAAIGDDYIIADSVAAYSRIGIVKAIYPAAVMGRIIIDVVVAYGRAGIVA